MQSDPYLFRSQRLGFREWGNADLKPFAEMNADNEVMRYFPATRTLEESKASLHKFMAHYEKHGFCFYPVDELTNGKFIGFVGLNRPQFQADFMPCVEIGWRLKKEFWNKGYATEAAKKMPRFRF